jgi:hypothetical protein
VVYRVEQGFHHRIYPVSRCTNVVSGAGQLCVSARRARNALRADSLKVSDRAACGTLQSVGWRGTGASCPSE